MEAAVQQVAATGVALFGEVAKMYEEGYLGARRIRSPGRRGKRKTFYLHQYIVPRWGKLRLNQIQPKAVEDWLHTTFDSWWTMHGVRAIMIRIFNYAEGHGLWEEGKRSPVSKAKLGKKRHKRERRILSFEETARVLARLEEPYRLIIETCIATGARISEVLGLKWKHVNLAAGTIKIEQRVWHQEIGRPKSEDSQRILGIGDLVERFPRESRRGRRHAGFLRLPAEACAGKAAVGLRRSRRTASSRGSRGLRLRRPRAALVPAREHHVAAAGRRQRDRGVEDRRPQRSGDDGRIHFRYGRTAERTDPPHPREAQQRGSETFDRVSGPSELGGREDGYHDSAMNKIVHNAKLVVAERFSSGFQREIF